MKRFAVALLVILGVAAHARAQGVAGAVRELLDSDDWASLRVAGEHVHSAEDVAEVSDARLCTDLVLRSRTDCSSSSRIAEVNDALLHAPGRASRRCFSAE